MSVIRTIGSKAASALDRELMSPEGGGFSIDQLMELAGLAVANAVYKEYPPSKYPKVLCAVGVGNNGGDALVCARHLTLFGYKVRVYYPLRSKKPLFTGLQTQLARFGVPIVETDVQKEFQQADQIVDGIFGFSFVPPVREPFLEVIGLLNEYCKKIPITSVDIPSGWDVDEGPVSSNFEPSSLVSLTAPKPCSKLFKGTHFVGGRFVNKELADKWDIDIPKYEGVDQVVKVQ
ncbi:BA75_03526T0 [Komagataella pastoris]|uniref:NAD(P)H-hydrate epimerase n=1 Tax=Komagataella pastoris TaxID=4922 RepID=A0A1B2JGX5_PICPA|nr:BA75_03526T0 [Komagataella pastoris]